MADQQSTSDRARRVQQFISQARGGDGGMRAWLARRAQVMQARTNEAALAKARGDQQQALRAAMQTPGALQLAESMQPGAATGGPAPVAPRAPVAPGASPAAVTQAASSPSAPSTASAPTPGSPPAPAAVDWGAYYDANVGDQAPRDPAAAAERRALFIQQQTPQNVAAQQARNQETSALQIARDASLGAMVPGSVGANGVDYGQGVADPSSALRSFDASGYTGQQALADGWGTGVGTPGWTTTSMNQRMNPNGDNRALTDGRIQQLAATPYVAPASAGPTPAPSPPIAVPAAVAQPVVAAPPVAPAPPQPAPTQAVPPPVAVPTPAVAPVAPAAPPANPSANLAAAIQRSNAPAAPPRPAAPPYRAPPAPVAPPTAPGAAPAGPRPSDDDVRTALSAPSRASGTYPRGPGAGSRVGLG